MIMNDWKKINQEEISSETAKTTVRAKRAMDI
jgi:hypothetical protein